jgi:cephalosporin-C deacetylase
MKPFPYPRLVVLCALVLVTAPLRLAADLAVKVTPDKTSGIYAPGEQAVWTVEVSGAPSGVEPVLTYKVTRDGKAPVSEGSLTLSANGHATVTATRDDAGVLLAQIFSPEKPGKAVALGGAIYAPEKIKPAAPAPADFDAFWSAKLKELDAVPVNPVLEKVSGVENTAGLDYYKVTLDNIRGTHVRGQLARPSAEGKYPALLVLQYAGVYPLKTSTVTNDAHAGWIVLNISAHDQPITEPQSFYDELNNGALKNYIGIGNEDREKSYFLRMFLGCVRAAEYLTSRPDWDGHTLVVTGGSQGGLQSLATAGLYPKVSALMVTVPAGCDTAAPLANRGLSWPGWMVWAMQDRDPKKVEATAGYFDGINFAARATAPSLVAYGLIDETARPTGIAAAVNALKGPTEAIILPLANHGIGPSRSIYDRRAGAWKKALLAGKPVPPATE